MAVEINFVASIDITSLPNKLALKDISNLDNIVMTNRYWIITDVEGNSSVIAHPLDTGGDTMLVNIEEDVAHTIQLSYNYNISTGVSGYYKRKNVMIAPKLTEVLYNLRKYFVDLLLDDDKQDKVEEVLKDTEMIDACNEACIRLLSTDLVSANKALEEGNKLANKYVGIIN